MKKLFRVLCVGLLGLSLAGCDLAKKLPWASKKEQEVVVPDEGNTDDTPVIPGGGDGGNGGGQTRPGWPDIHFPTDNEPINGGGEEFQSVCEDDPNVCNVTVSSETMAYDASEEELVTVYETVVKSVVTVISYSDDYTSLATGSGVIISKSNDDQYLYIYTNAHVVNISSTSRINGQMVAQTASKYEVVYYNNTRVVATLVASARRTENVAIFDRKVNNDVVKHSISLVIAYLCVALAATMIIGSYEAFDITDIMFEVISAIGTVGLSLNITANAMVFTKIILIFLMFFGRLGALTLFNLFLKDKHTSIIEKPDGKVLVG